MTKLTLPRTTTLFPNVAREIDEMQNRLRRYLNEPFATEKFPFTEPLGWVPAVEISETNDELVMTAELPGMKREEVEVFFEDDMLTIRGEKKEEKKEAVEKKYHMWERTYGAFQRSFTLPRTIDPAKILAEFKDGVLKVHMPKTPVAKAKEHKIEIKG
ncbi:MAG: Hsp20/alpha crystallin family protein [Gemmatimonadaceae bacterium]